MRGCVLRDVEVRVNRGKCSEGRVVTGSNVGVNSCNEEVGKGQRVGEGGLY